ncbi:MAG: hypothetical protein E6Q97_30565 [Desulfurellales bacterium]|nr:MAG: hypothetical protein E6Q97_30565 [Desulfurellales bacterium]
MPADHELTDEELKEFAQHGVILDNTPAPTEEAAPAATEEAAPAPTEEAAPVERPRDPVTGQFVPVTQTEEAPAEAKPETAAPEQPAAPPPGFVPHQALHQERLARQTLQAQLNTLQARTNAMLAAQAGGPQVEMPDMQTDPAGYVRALEARIEKFEETQAQTAQLRQIDNAFENDEATFKSYTPDYDDASEHYARSRSQELLAFYTPEQAQEIMLAEARQLAQEAWQRGMNAGELVYRMAQARGYTPNSGGAPASVVDEAMRAVANTPAPTPPAAAPSPSAVVAAAQQGQAATRTLSVGGGAATATQMNAEALLSMSDEEFEAYLKLGQKGANARFAAIG